jgi:hypothetical protein
MPTSQGGWICKKIKGAGIFLGGGGRRRTTTTMEEGIVSYNLFTFIKEDILFAIPFVNHKVLVIEYYPLMILLLFANFLVVWMVHFS